MKNERGITLIALILIMVCLIVLAGISISIVVSENNKKEQQSESNDISDITYDTSFEDENLLTEPIANVSDVVNSTVTNDVENSALVDNSVSNTVENVVEANTVNSVAQ